jgi:hypothetical protein
MTVNVFNQNRKVIIMTSEKRMFAEKKKNLKLNYKINQY